MVGEILNNLSIRTKIILAQIFLIASISVFIYNYYPNQQKAIALEAIKSKIQGISNMFSIGVGIGMGEIDLVAVSEALTWAKADSAVVYLSVMGTNGQPIVSQELETFPIDYTAVNALSDDTMAILDNAIYYKTDILYQGNVYGTLQLAYSLVNMEAALKQLKITTLYFCLSFFAVGVVVSVVIGNMITLSIFRLQSAVKSIGQGKQNTRVRISGNDEIGELGKAFNQMLDNVETSKEELVAYSKELKKQNQELSQFTYVVSHDLKAPLRAIFKLSEWIEEDMNGTLSEESKANMKTLRARTTRLEALINGLLDYAKIGRQSTKQEVTDASKLIQDILRVLNPPPHFKIDVCGTMPVFNTQKILLYQVLSNLLSNAIKYNDKASPLVRIMVRENVGCYEFSVEDNGIGIDPVYHKKVFMIFQTINARDQFESTGIGLAIIKKCLEIIGGEIRLSSKVGEGSTFTFTWPKEPKNRIVNNQETVNAGILE